MDASKSHVSTSSMGTISYQPPELLLGEGVLRHRPLLWRACRTVKRHDCDLAVLTCLDAVAFCWTHRHRPCHHQLLG